MNVGEGRGPLNGFAVLVVLVESGVSCIAAGSGRRDTGCSWCKSEVPRHPAGRGEWHRWLPPSRHNRLRFQLNSAVACRVLSELIHPFNSRRASVALMARAVFSSSVSDRRKSKE